MDDPSDTYLASIQIIDSDVQSLNQIEAFLKEDARFVVVNASTTLEAGLEFAQAFELRFPSTMRRFRHIVLVDLKLFEAFQSFFSNAPFRQFDKYLMSDEQDQERLKPIFRSSIMAGFSDCLKKNLDKVAFLSQISWLPTHPHIDDSSLHDPNWAERRLWEQKFFFSTGKTLLNTLKFRGLVAEMIPTSESSFAITGGTSLLGEGFYERMFRLEAENKWNWILKLLDSELVNERFHQADAAALSLILHYCCGYSLKDVPYRHEPALNADGA